MGSECGGWTNIQQVSPHASFVYHYPVGLTALQLARPLASCLYGSCTNCIGTNCIGTICIGTNCIGTNCIGNKLYREQTVSGTYCIGNKLYREQIVSGTNCIGSLSFFYPFILFLMHRIPNQKIPNHKKFLIVNNRH